MSPDKKSSPLTWLLAVWTVLCGSFLLHGAEVTVVHPTMDQRVGYPAIIPPDGQLPTWTVLSPSAGNLEGSLYDTETGVKIHSITPQPLAAGIPFSLNLNRQLPPVGVYQLKLTITAGNTVQFRTSSSFSVLDETTLPQNYSVVAHPGPHGRMRYIPDVRGNRIPDFSGVGYRGGANLPVVPTVRNVTAPSSGDARAIIQAAIDEVEARTPDANGFRGAVQLAAGIYEINGTLRIEQSGVVLRGVGTGPTQTFMLDPAQDLTLPAWKAANANTTATVLVATTTQHNPLLIVSGLTGSSVDASRTVAIVDDYVPVGSRRFHVANVSSFQIGDTIQLERRGNPAWITTIGMDRMSSSTPTWRPWDGVVGDPIKHFFEYTIADIKGDRITVDSEITTAIEQRWGGGFIRPMTQGGRIRDVGVENLRAISFWQMERVTEADGTVTGRDHTAHADQFVYFDRLRDAWADRIVAEHFTAVTYGSFQVGTDTLDVTLQNSSALAAPHVPFHQPPAYESSGRTHLASGTYVGRYGFHLGGQSGLVRNCFAVNMRHAFVLNQWFGAGPNVFVDSLAEDSVTRSEPHQRWAAGGLYDNITEETGIALMNRRHYGDGHGWSAANFVAWNTEGSLTAEQPPTAQNWAIGHVGTRARGDFFNWNITQFGVSDGYWEKHNTHVEPRSLYERQVADSNGFIEPDEPVVLVNTLFITAASSQAVDTVLTTATATAGQGRTITGWSIINGNSGGVFAINASGQLRLAQPSALPNPGAAQLIVRATDDLGVTGDGVINVICNPGPQAVLEQRWSGTNAYINQSWTGTTSFTGTLPTLTSAQNVGDSYSRRLSSYLRPQVTGNYTFWIAGDNECRLYLSTNGYEANKALIATVSSWTSFQQWNKTTSQQSATIPLVAGRIYWIEAQQNDRDREDHVSVAWSGPGISRQAIPSSVLISPPPGRVFEVPQPLPPNSAPTISPISDLSIGEDSATSAIAFTVADAETPAAALLVSGSSSNQALVSNASIVVTGSGTNRNVTVSPNSNQFGSTTITLSVSDGILTGSETFVLTVTPVNDAPVANNDNGTVNEGGNVMLNLAHNDTDADDGLDPTSIAIVSGPANGTLANHGNGTVTYSHNGSETTADSFTYTIEDLAGTASNVATVSLTITPQEDTPPGPPNLTLTNTSFAPTPSILGYNLGTFMPGSNTADWWRYSGVNAARMFINPSTFPLPSTNGVTDQTSFITKRAELRANPLSSTWFNWTELENRFENRDVLSARVNPTIRALRDLGVEMLIQSSASESTLVIADANDWTGKWRLWKHYYALAYHLGRHFDVRRYQTFNEPDHSSADGLTPTNWLMRLQLASDAIRCAIADVNATYGKSLVPLVYAPTTASANFTPDWGGLAISNLNVDFLGQYPGGFTLFDRYNYHQYNGSPSTFGSRVGTIRTAVENVLPPNHPTMPLALSEFNVHTAATFATMPETLNTPAKFSRFGGIVAELARNRLEEMWVFKFTQTEHETSSSGFIGVKKNGMYYADLNTSPYTHGGPTHAAEVWRLFNKAFAPGRELLEFTATTSLADIHVIAVRDPATGRHYIFSANDTPSSVPLAIDISDTPIQNGAWALLEEVGPQTYGAVAKTGYEPITSGRLRGRTQPPYSVWLYTIETRPAGPELMVPVGGDAMVKDGSNKNTNYGNSSRVVVKNDTINANARNAGLLRYILPPRHASDLQLALLEVDVAPLTPDTTAQAFVYGLNNTVWSETSLTWSNITNLRQNVPAGALIQNNIVANAGVSAFIQGQLVSDGSGFMTRTMDVTDYVRQRFTSGDAAFLIAQENRWDDELGNGVLTGDGQPGGLQIVSKEGATATEAGSRLRLVFRRDPNGDAPVANNDSGTVNEGGNILLNLALNDTDADDGLNLTSIVIVTGPANGMLTNHNNGTLTYSHNGSETTADSFTYTIKDLAGTASNVATVAITVVPDPVNDYTAWNDAYEISEGPGVDSDGDGISNLIEYIIGGDPADQMDTALLPSAQLVTADPDEDLTSSDYLLFTYRRAVRAAGNPAVDIRVEWSADPVTSWHKAANTSGVVTHTEPLETGVELIKVYIPRNIQANGKLFARLAGVIDLP